MCFCAPEQTKPSSEFEQTQFRACSSSRLTPKTNYPPTTSTHLLLLSIRHHQMEVLEDSEVFYPRSVGQGSSG